MLAPEVILNKSTIVPELTRYLEQRSYSLADSQKITALLEETMSSK